MTTNTDNLALGKRTIYTFPPKILVPDQENIRTEDMGDLDALALDIMQNGIQVPLKVRRVTGRDQYIVTDGHRRLAAVQLAKDMYGRKIEGLPCVLEDKGTEPVDRLFTMLSTGTHQKPLTPIEEGRAYVKALEKFGVKVRDIADRCGRSVKHVEGCMALARNPEAFAGLSPAAAAETTKIPSAQAKKIVAGGARTAGAIKQAATGKPKPVGKVVLRREYQRFEKLEATAPTLMSDLQRGYLRGLAFARGVQPALELEAA